MTMVLSTMDVLLLVVLVTLPIISGLTINPNIAEVCNSPSLETVVGIPADQTCIKHNNITRCWYTYIPDSVKTFSSSNSSVPLVFDLHGYNLCAVYQANFTGWRQVAEEQGFVIVWPQGNMNANLSNNPCWDFGDCCCSLGPPPPENATNSSTSSNLFDSFVPGPDMDDEGFLRQVVSNVVAETAESLSNYNVTIDTKRIYFGGHSNGCMMSQAMAALSSDLVAAVCCHASSFPFDAVDDDYIATSVQVVYGDLDTTIEAIFGSFSHIIDTWSAINDCQQSNRTIVDDDYAINTRFNCSNDTIVQTIELFDTGHFPFQGFNPNNSLSVGEYPGAKTPTVDTARLSWDFCSQFTSQVAPSLPDPVETVPADVFAAPSGSDGSEPGDTNGDTNEGDANNDGDGANQDTSSSSSSTDHTHKSTFVSLSTIGITIILATVIPWPLAAE